MGLSVPVAGEGVTIRNNYIKQNAFNGEWGQADSSGKVRGSYGIEAPQAPAGQPGGIVEGNVVISERSVMAVSAPGKDTIVRNNKFYGPYTWSVVGGEPGSLGFGSVNAKSNLHEKDASKHPKHRQEAGEYREYKEYKERKEYKEYKERKEDKETKANNQRKASAVVKDETTSKKNEVIDIADIVEVVDVVEQPVRQAPVREEKRDAKFTHLSDLEFAVAANGLGEVERDQSNGGRGADDGGTLRLNNRTYDKGVGVAGDSEVVIELDGQYETFFSDIGIDDAAGQKGELTFEVWTDGERPFDSGEIKGNHNTESVRIDVAGARELKLVTVAGNGHKAHEDQGNDLGNWADARLQLMDE